MADFVDYYEMFNLDSASPWEEIHKKLQGNLDALYTRSAHGYDVDQSELDNFNQALEHFASAEARTRYDAELAQANRTEEDELIDAIAKARRWVEEENRKDQAEYEMDKHIKKIVERIGLQNITCNTLCEWGLVNLLLGRVKEADDAAHEANSHDGLFPGGYYLLGNVAEARGNLETAKFEWNNALERERSGNYGNLYYARIVSALTRLSLHENGLDVKKLERADIRKKYRSFLTGLKENLAEALAIDPDSSEAEQAADLVSKEFEKADQGQINEARNAIDECSAKFKKAKRTDEELLHAGECRQYANELNNLAKRVDAAQLSLREIGEHSSKGDELAKLIQEQLARTEQAGEDVENRKQQLSACADEVERLLQAGNIAAAQSVMRTQAVPLSKGLGSHNVSSDLTLRFARSTLSAQMANEARSFTQQLLDRGDSVDEASLIMGHLLRMENRFEEALNWYLEARKSNNSLIIAQAIRGQAFCLLNTGKPSDEQLAMLEECQAYDQKLGQVEGLLQEALSYDVSHPENEQLRTLLNQERMRLAPLHQAALQRHNAELAAAQEQARKQKEAERRKGIIAIVAVIVVAIILIAIFVKYRTQILTGAMIILGIYLVYKWLTD